jgi:hypothetical protein
MNSSLQFVTGCAANAAVDLYFSNDPLTPFVQKTDRCANGVWFAIE